MHRHPAELRADFQRYYGLNLDGMGRDYSTLHAADLAACLPRESCSMTAEDPLNGWTLELQLLALIEWHLADWNWAHTKDGKARRNRPKLLIPKPKGKPGSEAGKTVAMTREEMENFIGGLFGPAADDEEGGDADG